MQNDTLAKSYGLTLKFDVPSVQAPMGGGAHSLANFWQWVGSARIRTLTGWKEQRQTFVEGIDEYRLAYEARKQAKA